MINSSELRLKELSRELDVGIQVIWLLSEVQAEEDRLISSVKRKKTTFSLRSENASQASRTIEDSQYRKAIRFLISCSVAQVYDDVKMEMYQSTHKLALPSSLHLFSAFESLSVSAYRPEWSSLDNIDFPIHQHHLSRVVDQPFINILTTKHLIPI